MSNDWKSEVAAILFDRLEWYTCEADACGDGVEAGKYRHEASKIAEVLLALINVQTVGRPTTDAEDAALRMARWPGSKDLHRRLLLCNPKIAER